MEEIVTQQKNQKLVKTIAWILIVLSALVLLRSVFSLQSLSTIVTLKGITKNFNPPVELNYAPFIFQSAIELLLCVIVFVSASYVLKFKKIWKQVLIYGLIASIIYLFVSPLINYYNPTFLAIDALNDLQKKMLDEVRESFLIWSYTWSVIISAFFIYTIIKLSKEEIKLLFK